jgi:long-chain acyl-CoA synthetase
VSFYRASWNKDKAWNCLGTKTKVEGSTDKFEYRWKSYDQVYQDVHRIANAIKKSGFAAPSADPDTDVKIDVVGIVGINREEWLVTDLACNLLGVTSVPLYETLGQEMINLILKESEMTTLFGTKVCLKSVLTNSKGFDNQLKTVISFDTEDAELVTLATEMGISVLYYSHLLSEYKTNFEIIDASKHQLDSIFTISYTSGTSGNSKGVLLTNGNFLSAYANIL